MNEQMIAALEEERRGFELHDMTEQVKAVDEQIALHRAAQKRAAARTTRDDVPQDRQAAPQETVAESGGEPQRTRTKKSKGQ